MQRPVVASFVTLHPPIASRASQGRARAAANADRARKVGAFEGGLMDGGGDMALRLVGVRMRTADAGRHAATAVCPVSGNRRRTAEPSPAGSGGVEAGRACRGLDAK